MGICEEFRKVPKIQFLAVGRCFWHFRKSFWQITLVRIAEKPIKWAFEVKFRECPKFSFWQWDRCFWHFGMHFWQITVVRVSGKPIK